MDLAISRQALIHALPHVTELAALASVPPGPQQPMLLAILQQGVEDSALQHANLQTRCERWTLAMYLQRLVIRTCTRMLHALVEVASNDPLLWKMFEIRREQ